MTNDLLAETDSATASIGPRGGTPTRRRRETERHQRSRTNRSGLDEERVEGNVVTVRADVVTPEVDIANRDGVVTLRLIKDAKTVVKDVQPGDHVSGDGWKEHGYLYWVEVLDVER